MVSSAVDERRRMRVRIASTLLLLALALLFLRLRHTHGVASAAQRFPVRGVDVSHHQGAIDWPKVANEPNLVFAWIKATEGGDFTDPRFAENIANAERAGVWVGAYHFFTLCRPPLEQADHFLAVITPSRRSLPVAVDVEVEGNCKIQATREVLVRDLGVWLDAVGAARSKRPTLYAKRELYDAYLAELAPRVQLWIRDVEHEPSLPWTFWQFADDARVSGIEGRVDMNAFLGDRDALGRF
jgi:lysozyme